MKGKSILIIGGAGFLGKSILSLIDQDNTKVYYADLNPIKGLEDFFIELDVLNEDSFTNIKFDIIINLTGQVTKPSNLCFQLNSYGIKNIISFVKQQNAKLIHISTVSVYGSSDSVIKEKSDINPETFYGSIKAMAEFLIQSALKPDQYNIIRISNLYGEKQPKGMLAYLIRSINNNEKIHFNNDGTMLRHFLHVNDAAALITKIINNFKPGVYNFPGVDSYTIKELIRLFEDITKKKLLVEYKKSKSWENLLVINSTKITETFDVKRKHILKDWLTTQLIKQ
ncbi:NAD(P)-dependent oxidoreductase [Flavobacteriaceae bacterium PRS1]|nr:NAD(P)-dependent oxidoreductase [Flavobacteriaceae bacterium PRS1]